MEAGGISQAHVAVYDRQIRIWGFEAQKLLFGARLLFAGLPGVAAEAAKNCVLAGFGSVALMDDTPRERAAPGNFLVAAGDDSAATVAAASAETLREMNPHVRLDVIAGRVGDKPPAFFKQFDVVIVAGESWTTLGATNAACRAAGVKFFAAASYQRSGFFFSDLGPSFSYTLPAPEGESPPPPPPPMSFFSLKASLAIPWDKLPRKLPGGYAALRLVAEAESPESGIPESGIPEAALARRRAVAASLGAAGLESVALESLVRDAASGAASESPAISAILGGFLAQEVHKAVTAQGEPAPGWLFFDAETGAGRVARIGA